MKKPKTDCTVSKAVKVFLRFVFNLFTIAAPSALLIGYLMYYELPRTTNAIINYIASKEQKTFCGRHCNYILTRSFCMKLLFDHGCHSYNTLGARELAAATALLRFRLGASALYRTIMLSIANKCRLRQFTSLIFKHTPNPN